MTSYTLNLYKSLIYETVKNETHLTAHSQRAMDKNAAELANIEEAGDEAYHERKLERSLYASLDKIKAEINDYIGVVASSFNTANANQIDFTLSLNGRFNTSYLTPLADLISKYVEDSMLFEWWTPVNQNYAKIYAEKAEIARQSIFKCFVKTTPAMSTKSCADITGTIATS